MDISHSSVKLSLAHRASVLRLAANNAMNGPFPFCTVTVHIFTAWCALLVAISHFCPSFLGFMGVIVTPTVLEGFSFRFGSHASRWSFLSFRAFQVGLLLGFYLGNRCGVSLMSDFAITHANSLDNCSLYFFQNGDIVHYSIAFDVCPRSHK